MSTVFESIGGAAFVAGVFALIAAFVDTSNGHSGAPGAIAGSICILMAALYIGIGQGLDFMSRASHRSDRLGALLTDEILPHLKAMDARFAGPPSPPTSEIATPIQASYKEPDPVEEPEITDPEYFYSKNGKEEGPFSAAELKTFRMNGVIKDTTPIFRSGNKDWFPFRKLLDLAKS
jgi:GYF domain 2